MIESGDSEHIFRQLIEHSPDFFLRLDRQGRITYINHLRPGDEVDDIVGKHVLDLIQPEYRPQYDESLARVLDGAEVGTLESQSLDGNHWLTRFAPIKNAEEVVGISVVATNITEQVRLREEITESEERFRYLSRAANEAIFLTRGGRCIDVNETATRMFGFSRDEFRGEHVSQFVVPESRDLVRSRVVEDEVGPYELELLRKNGTTFWAEIQAKNLPYRGETVRVATIHDITDRKLATDARMESETKYRSLIEATGTGYLIIDDRGLVMDANPEYVRLTGHETLDEILGRSVVEWTAPHDRKRNAEEVARCREIGFVSDLEIDYQGPDGTLTPIEINARVVDDDDGPRILALCRDGSIRRQLDQERQRAHRELRKIVDSIPDLFYVVDMEGRFTFWNNSIEQATELSAAELQKMHVLNLIHPDDRSAATQAITNVLATGSASAELKVLKKSGGAVPYAFSGTIKRDDAGNTTGFFGIGKDISDRIRTEDALRQSEEKYKGIFNEAVATIYVFDQDKNFIDSNQAGLDLLGYSREVLLDMNIADVDADHMQVKPAHHQLLSGGKIVNFEHRLKRKDGSTIVVLNNSRPLFDAGGSITGMQSTLVDITEHRRAEEALRQSEQNLSNLFSTAEDLFFIFDLEGTILEINNQVLEKLGYTKDEIVGSNALRIHPPNRAREVEEVLAEMIAGKQDLCRIPLITRSGVEIPAETSVTKGVWGEQDVLFGISRDITSRKRLEEELLRTRKLESLGVLAGGIAHDFNNLLTAILGNLSVAKQDIDRHTKLHDTLSSAEVASENAQRLTQQLLTFSQGGLPVMKVVNIDRLIMESASFVLSGSNVKCQFDVADDLWPVEVDEGLISQVIGNIVINADQAMPRGGTMTIRAGNIHRSPDGDLPSPEGEFIKISVTDEGSGIPPEILGKIFDPYFTTKERGSGLGLATSHSIIANHGGSITTTPNPGVGVTFHIHLPASPTERPVEESPYTPITTGSGRILVMDDEEIVQKVVGAMLEMLGYEVAFADEGETTLKLYREAKESRRPFDAVVMDLTIRGGMGGKETIGHLRAYDPEVKAIVSSGYSTDPIMADYASYGFAGMLTKPFDVECLSTLLTELLGAD